MQTQIVHEDGIYEILDSHDGFHGCMKLILTKEAFIEAYEKYIQPLQEIKRTIDVNLNEKEMYKLSNTYSYKANPSMEKILL